MPVCDDGEGSGTSFRMVLHACRHCGGRILQSGSMFRCSCCAATTMGAPDEVCGCGMLASWGSRPPKAQAPLTMKTPDTITRWTGKRPFRCGLNPAQSAKSPSEVVILFAGDEDDAGDVRLAA